MEQYYQFKKLRRQTIGGKKVRWFDEIIKVKYHKNKESTRIESTIDQFKWLDHNLKLSFELIRKNESIVDANNLCSDKK